MVRIGEYRNYKIDYYNSRFFAIDEEGLQVAQGDTEDEVKSKINDIIKSKTTSVPAIFIGNPTGWGRSRKVTYGQVTSLSEDRGTLAVRFSFEDEDGKKRWRRVGFNWLYEDTPENREKAQHLVDLWKKLEGLEKEVYEAEHKEFEKPITGKNIRALMGLE